MKNRIGITGMVIGLLFVLSIAGSIYQELGPSAECGQPSSTGQTTAQILVSGGRHRCYLLHVPTSYRPDAPVPLVITLHGFASNASRVQALTRWDELAEREGFVTVYPDGSLFPLRWNTDRFTNATASDVQLIRDLIAHLSTRLAIDPTRVYINGFSNGGGMALIAACRAADLIAAVGSVEPGGVSKTTLEACLPNRPVPAIEFTGTGAQGALMGERAAPGTPETISPLMGALFNLSTEPFVPAVPEEHAAYWAKVNQCEAAPITSQAQDSVSVLRYTACPMGAEVVLYRIHGMGHQWPGGVRADSDAVGAYNSDVDATALLWAFFKLHPHR